MQKMGGGRAVVHLRPQEPADAVPEESEAGTTWTLNLSSSSRPRKKMTTTKKTQRIQSQYSTELRSLFGLRLTSWASLGESEQTAETDEEPGPALVVIDCCCWPKWLGESLADSEGWLGGCGESRQVGSGELLFPSLSSRAP